jgi:hypothetical protein
MEGTKMSGWKAEDLTNILSLEQGSNCLLGHHSIFHSWTKQVYKKNLTLIQGNKK